MKKKHALTILTAVALLAVLFWALRRGPEEERAEPPAISEQIAPQDNPRSVSHPEKVPPAATQPQEPSTNSQDFAAWQARLQQQREQQVDQALDQWRTPIEFYGKAVDEAESPVPDAQVGFSCNDLSQEGTSNYHATSDRNGLFSITGIKGKLLTANVSKAGYYASKRDARSFYYAGQNVNFVPDANTPVLFHLRKVGRAEPLVTVVGTMPIPKDGAPVGLSFTTAKVTAAEAAEMVVQCWTDDQGKRPGQKFNWRCKLTVPGGGLQVLTGEFPFLAPESGYQPSVEIDMPASLDVGWRNKAATSYFLRLGNGDYARIEFEMIPYGEHSVMVKCYLNSTGSRNLEGEPNLHFTTFSH